MTRDYSAFLGGTAPAPQPQITPLQALGWSATFAGQTDADQLTDTPPVRVIEVTRAGLHVIGDGIDEQLPPNAEATVGDWMLLNRALPTSSQILERKSIFRRRAPGKAREMQNIAANVDTVFIVSSCNMDFNVARIERYLALAFEADVEPVIILTKADLTEDAADYERQASLISAQVPVLVLNPRHSVVSAPLAPWCKAGQTIAFLGSSGVGKSTLVNSLMGRNSAQTGAIREDDSKGRHTTTSRQIHLADGGFAILDTPGMRELQLAETERGISELFDDISELALHCKFSDCAHITEPGCAIRAAIDAGDLTEERLDRWRKLLAEDAHNSASIAKRRAKDKSFGKMVKSAMKHKKR